MNEDERVLHIISVTKDKKRINKWLDDKIGKPTHKMLNPYNLTQLQIDSYWLLVKEKIQIHI